jgi:hypothetical protein
VKSGRSAPTLQGKLQSSCARYIMEGAGSPAMSVHFHHTIQHHTSKGRNIHDVFYTECTWSTKCYEAGNQEGIL